MKIRGGRVGRDWEVASTDGLRPLSPTRVSAEPKASVDAVS